MSPKSLLSCLLAAALLTSAPAWSAASAWNAEQAKDGETTAAYMIGDLLVARPLGIVAAGVGTAAFLVSLPFTLMGDNVKEAADHLVVGPAHAAFTRCLGCKE